MNCDHHTIKGGTVTSEGIIPHKRHPAGFDMPVKLVIKKFTVAAIMEDHPPLRNAMGNLVYAMPGGGEFVDV